jgi:hypothetical protein
LRALLYRLPYVMIDLLRAVGGFIDDEAYNSARNQCGRSK